ncbi:hypothetical protein AYL99_03785 [Fonsecaea erecta]|uniref:Phosphotransferase n=1 Tax=Fonsecaea erecta TaxID=1367422 RepID=A0A178ZPL1_9EURO|nr:hypothetical protein AYL99_03785 [Fonsecaea erecta]OAP61582.1 hypothetical protein AYL99_03785 [Fonsecaea erecta]
MSAHTQNLQFSREDVEFEIPSDLPEKLGEELRRLEQLFTVDTTVLKKITDRFGEELDEGLRKHGSNVPMNITWVTSFPTGHETGTYLTLDLGGTNLRVCLITLSGRQGGTDITQEKYQLPKEIKTGTADELFEYLADRLADFVEKHVKADDTVGDDGKVPLGFTFSYPATQERIDHGILQTWTKGWDVKGVEGNDVAEMLRGAIEKRDLPVKLVALINDTTGALIASAYNDPKTIIGAIFGTGCNAAYMERTYHIPKLQRNGPSSNGTTATAETKDAESDDSFMAINCEYGAFDNSHAILPRTRYDELIDEQSPRPGEQTFEKMSAGLYLGEIFRQILIDLHQRGVIFQDVKLDDQQKELLNTPYAIDTEFLSNLENDSSPSLSSSARAFESTLSNLHPSQSELLFSQAVAKLIAIRGARLCACGVSAICRRIGTRKGHVAADGSVAIKHPRFKERWEDAVREILDMKMGAKAAGGGEGGLEGIELTSAEDGSGVGAAVITALTLGRRGGQ